MRGNRGVFRDSIRKGQFGTETGVAAMLYESYKVVPLHGISDTSEPRFIATALGRDNIAQQQIRERSKST
jgi:hypothetical protein